MIFFLPFIYPTVNEWIAGIDFGTRLNPLIASSIYFLLPGVFLGTISPYVIRLAATKLSTVGSTAGTLYAVSTCGSIFGTLLTAFYLIPLMGVSNIIHFLGVTVGLPFAARAAAGEAARRLTAGPRGNGLSSSSDRSLCLGTGRCGRELKTLLEKDTFYHRIRVEEDDEARYMYFDRTLQSAMNLEGSDGATPDLFALHLPRLRLSARREENADHRPRRRLDPEETAKGISVHWRSTWSKSTRK